MKTTAFSLVFLLCVLGCSHKTGSNVADTSQAQAAAQKAVEQWVTLIDVGNYAESWTNAAEYFQTSISPDQWEHAVSTARGPLGNVVSRQLASAQYTTSLPDAPAGQYVVLQFNTSFANKKDAIETITPMLDLDGQWKVSGYYVK